MSCVIFLLVFNGYLVINIDDIGFQFKVWFICNLGYVLFGGLNFYCNKIFYIWFGNIVCSFEKIFEGE